MISSTHIEPHWNYLLAMDADLVQLSRYVEFDSRNYACFSIEITRLLLAAASEVDVVCKQVCRIANPSSAADNIVEYRDEITLAYPRLASFPVLMPRFGLTLQPWEAWQAGGVPAWWTAYNKVKHERDAHYDRANLKNALNAVAGLFVVVLYLYKQKAEFGELVPSPQVLDAGDGYRGGMTLGRREVGRGYAL
jgi:hypothetical protein